MLKMEESWYRLLKDDRVKGMLVMLGECTKKKRVKDFEWFKDKMLLAQKQEARIELDDHVDAFESDSDKAPTTRPIFMERISLVGSVNGDDVGPSYGTHILSKELLEQARPLRPSDENLDFAIVPNQAASTSAKSPSKNDLDLLFQPMFNEYPTPSVISSTISATALTKDKAETPSSTTIDQDAPSPSTTPITDETITLIHVNNVEEQIQDN
ncbi:hypothetical protein Tco_0300739 [Tanacetum coccineum]